MLLDSKLKDSLNIWCPRYLLEAGERTRTRRYLCSRNNSACPSMSSPLFPQFLHLKNPIFQTGSWELEKCRFRTGTVSDLPHPSRLTPPPLLGSPDPPALLARFSTMTIYHINTQPRNSQSRGLVHDLELRT